MKTNRDLALSRRHLLGASVGAGAALLATRGNAAPARPTGPYLRRSQETTKLTFWHQSPEQLAPFQRFMADFTATNPGIEVEVEMTPRDQWEAKLQTALNSGSGPDVFSRAGRP